MYQNGAGWYNTGFCQNGAVFKQYNTISQKGIVRFIYKYYKSLNIKYFLIFFKDNKYIIRKINRNIKILNLNKN